MERYTFKTKYGWQLDANLSISGDVNIFNNAIDKLASLENAEEQGRLMILACNPHTFVYFINDDKEIMSGFKYLSSIYQNDKLIHILYLGRRPFEYVLSDNIYFTKEEAERANKSKL